MLTGTPARKANAETRLMHPTTDEPGARRARFDGIAPRAVALALLALALAACGGSSPSSSTSTTTAPPPPKPAIPVAVTASQLHSLATSTGHPVYWAGTFNGTYELTTIADGRTYIRYLPPGVPVGTSTLHLTIGTYVRPTPPFAAIRAAATRQHAKIVKLKAGELAVQYRTRPQSVFLIFPGALYEVEVYDPLPATALKDATDGQVAPIP